MTVGYRSCSYERNLHKLRLIEKPINCKNYQRAATGKFFRLLLTKQGKLFFNGQNRRSLIGIETDKTQHTDKFYEITSYWPVNHEEDKIVDCDGGRDFIIVCTASGKVYASGSSLSDVVNSAIKVQSSSEDKKSF